MPDDHGPYRGLFIKIYNEKEEFVNKRISGIPDHYKRSKSTMRNTDPVIIRMFKLDMSIYPVFSFIQDIKIINNKLLTEVKIFGFIEKNSGMVRIDEFYFFIGGEGKIFIHSLKHNDLVW
jgi:hypothetical protein